MWKIDIYKTITRKFIEEKCFHQPEVTHRIILAACPLEHKSTRTPQPPIENNKIQIIIFNWFEKSIALNSKLNSPLVHFNERAVNWAQQSVKASLLLAWGGWQWGMSVESSLQASQYKLPWSCCQRHSAHLKAVRCVLIMRTF